MNIYDARQHKSTYEYITKEERRKQIEDQFKSVFKSAAAVGEKSFFEQQRQQ